MRRHLFRLGIFVRMREWCPANEVTPCEVRVGLAGEAPEEPLTWLEIEPGKTTGTVICRLAGHDASGNVVHWKADPNATDAATTAGLAEAGRAAWQTAIYLMVDQMAKLTGS